MRRSAIRIAMLRWCHFGWDLTVYEGHGESGKLPTGAGICCSKAGRWIPILVADDCAHRITRGSTRGSGLALPTDRVSITPVSTTAESDRTMDRDKPVSRQWEDASRLDAQKSEHDGINEETPTTRQGIHSAPGRDATLGLRPHRQMAASVQSHPGEAIAVSGSQAFGVA